MKILIVDDETLARNRIVRFLKDLKFNGEIHQAENGLQAIDLTKTQNFDLIFLDIQMPGLTGFETLQQIEHKNFVVIFQTAYDEFAIKAFESNACDYLLKPFTKERFEQAFLKATKSVENQKKLLALETTLQKQGQYVKNLAVKQNGKTKIVNLSHIDCFLSEDHYTIIYSKGEELISDLTLSWLEQRLDPNQFIRCHRNNIVAISKIKSIGDTQNSEVILESGQRLPLSRNKRKSVLDHFNVRSLENKSIE